MPEETDRKGVPYLTKARLEAITDGIFAFAMTLLVINLLLPDKTNLVQTNDYALHTLLSLYSSFFHYVLAFLILGAFWIGHHIQFHSVQIVNRTFVWINLVTLMFVALLPFSTSYYGAFNETAVGAIVFEANLFVLGMGLFVQWRYATRGGRLVEPSLHPTYVRRVAARNLVVPVVSVLCMIIALAGSTWSTALYMTLPFIDYLTERIIT